MLSACSCPNNETGKAKDRLGEELDSDVPHREELASGCWNTFREQRDAGWLQQQLEKTQLRGVSLISLSIQTEAEWWKSRSKPKTNVSPHPDLKKDTLLEPDGMARSSPSVFE